jgi:D-arginine dehydrogenase
MAGASLAAETAGQADVMMIEAETQPGYHSTGRSAAFWAETYGGAMIQPLTAASRSFLANPPGDFHGRPLLAPRGAITIARDGDEGLLADLAVRYRAMGVAVEELDRTAIEDSIPGLRSQWRSGLAEPGCRDIDVAALHGAYLRRARVRGARLLTDAAVTAIERRDGRWHLTTGQGTIEARILVDAAGAWADEIALLAGVAAIGIQPYRRTMAQLRTLPLADPAMPLVLDAGGSFYFKPEAGGRLWVTPHDESPCTACDAAPEEVDVALAVDRLQQVVDWQVERVEHRWAGLRSFAPDRLPVYGFAAGVPDFFWFAGQGGFGIQTAPAAAKLAAALLLGRAPDPLVGQIDPAPYSPARFAN